MMTLKRKKVNNKNETIGIPSLGKKLSSCKRIKMQVEILF
jgi:hypothetical protein